MSPNPEILARLPHRPPFLFVDEITGHGENAIHTAVTFPPDWPVFSGHYPGHPVVPGAILCEAIFQSGALLIGELAAAGLPDLAANLPANQSPGQPSGLPSNLPVVARIFTAKFKRQVLPGEQLEIEVKLSERLASAWLMKGIIRVAGKVAAQVEFSCALTS